MIDAGHVSCGEVKSRDRVRRCPWRDVVDEAETDIGAIACNMSWERSLETDDQGPGYEQLRMR